MSNAGPQRSITVLSLRRTSSRRLFGRVLLLFSLAFAPGSTHAQAEKRPPAGAASTRTDRALIVVGLPGDDEHSASFRELAGTFRQWLTGPLGFPESGVRILFGAVGRAEPQGRRRHSRGHRASRPHAIRDGLAPEGRLWVIVAGPRQRTRRTHVPALAGARPARRRTGKAVRRDHLPRTGLLDHHSGFRRVSQAALRQGAHRDHGDHGRPGIERDRVSPRTRRKYAGNPPRNSTRTSRWKGLGLGGFSPSREACRSPVRGRPTNAHRARPAR